MHEMILGTGTNFKQQGQEPVSVTPLVQIGSTVDMENGTAARSLKSTRNQAFSDSESSRENVDDSDLDTASRDCISCSDTDKVSIQTAWKKYRKRVWNSCRLSKGSIWMEVQLKRISDSCQGMWGHDHESIRTDWKCTVVEKLQLL